MKPTIETYYAVNLADYHSVVANEPFHPVRLMFGRILMKEDNLVTCEGKRWDGEAIRVKRDTPQEQQIIREGLGNLPPRHKNLFRIYESKTGKGGWKRI